MDIEEKISRKVLIFNLPHVHYTFVWLLSFHRTWASRMINVGASSYLAGTTLHPIWMGRVLPALMLNDSQQVQAKLKPVRR